MNLLEMQIDTADAPAVRQPPCRMPFTVRQEVAQQFREMQEAGVVQLSSSPSPVVMVKKDGTTIYALTFRDSTRLPNLAYSPFLT